LYSYPESKSELFTTSRAVKLFGTRIQRDSSQYQSESCPAPGWEKPDNNNFHIRKRWHLG